MADRPSAPAEAEAAGVGITSRLRRYSSMLTSCSASQHLSIHS